MLTKKEIWKPIPGYEGLYEISSYGRVLSLFRLNFRRDKILKPSLNIHGYYQLTLCKDNIKKNWRIHVLVAMAFLNHIPAKNHNICVDHINEVKTDNRPDNLQIISSRFNCHKSKNIKSKTSKYIGVSYNNKIQKWVSSIYYKKPIYLGIFNSEYEAHLAYTNKLNQIINNHGEI